MQNAVSVFEKTLHRNYKALRVILQPAETIVLTAPEKELPSDQTRSSPKTVYEAKSNSPYHQEKQKLFDLIQRMKTEGLSINQIRLQIKRHHTTVARYFHAADYLTTTRIRGCWKRKLITPFLAHLEQRWAEGCTNAGQLYREIKEQGYRGSPLTVRRATTDWREPTPLLVAAPPPKLPSLKTLCWMFLKPLGKLNPEERNLREKLLASSLETARGLKLIEEFRLIVRKREVEQFDAWLERSRKNELIEFANFERGLRRDEAAVRAALEHEWSQGQVEGQVNRLKLIKRQMFGRANFDLLKARVLYRF